MKTLQEIRKELEAEGYTPPTKEEVEKIKIRNQKRLRKKADNDCVMCGGSGKMYAAEGLYTTCICVGE